jgi:hypothetical protein
VCRRKQDQSAGRLIVSSRFHDRLQTVEVCMMTGESRRLFQGLKAEYFWQSKDIQLISVKYKTCNGIRLMPMEIKNSAEISICSEKTG